jgi:hypothetical protein
MAQVRFELPRLANDHLKLGSQLIYTGLASSELLWAWEGVLRIESEQLSIGRDRCPWLRDGSDDSLAEVEWALRVDPSGRASTMTEWSVSYPNTLSVFTDATAPRLSQQPAFLDADVSVAADTRNYSGHPTSGGLYRVTAASYADQTYGELPAADLTAESLVRGDLQYNPGDAIRRTRPLRAWTVSGRYSPDI